MSPSVGIIKRADRGSAIAFQLLLGDSVPAQGATIPLLAIDEGPTRFDNQFHQTIIRETSI